MDKKAQIFVAGIFAMFGALLLSGLIYLAFVFPKALKIWADEGEPLPAGIVLLANLSELSKSTGIFLIPILVLAIITCGVWAVRAGLSSND